MATTQLLLSRTVLNSNLADFVKDALNFLLHSNFGHMTPELLQSPCGAHHSMELMVLRVLADTPCAVDGCDLGLLALLNRTTAFDMVNHAMILRRREMSYVIGGIVHSWFAILSWWPPAICS